MAVAETTGEDVLADRSVEDRSGVETKDLMERFIWQFITCDDDCCDCRNGRPSDFHGPYLRRHYLNKIETSNGRVHLRDRSAPGVRTAPPPKPFSADVEEPVRE